MLCDHSERWATVITFNLKGSSHLIEPSLHAYSLIGESTGARYQTGGEPAYFVHPERVVLHSCLFFVVL